MAITRRPCARMIEGITTAGLGLPDYRLALDQHHRYACTLQELGMDVLVLDSDNQFPDSVFIEDVAVCLPACAVIANPGAMSRNGEKHGILEFLADYYDEIVRIEPPGTLEGGDVLEAGGKYFIGLSGRTNAEGARQLLDILTRHGLDGWMVPLEKLLHLKTGVSWIGQETLLVSGELARMPIFKPFRRILVPDSEAYAANSLWINGTVLMPEGYPQTRDQVKAAGFSVKELDVSEFRKLDGGLSCLSLRF